MSPYRTPAERPRGPRWGVSRLARLYVRVYHLFASRTERDLRRHLHRLNRMHKLQTEKLRILNSYIDEIGLRGP